MSFGDRPKYIWSQQDEEFLFSKVQQFLSFESRTFRLRLNGLSDRLSIFMT
ncbi:MAG: hypothetical protein KME01_13270 [Chroococcus sp. CMT-3BRIN-NPC107]|nr:hypothetical protein [Chroococcus sp. CMT-3BRIN-NPC107]